MHLALLTVLWLALDPSESARYGAVVFTGKDVVIVRTWELRPDLGVKAVGATGDPIAIPSSALLVLSADIDASSTSILPRVTLRGGEVIAAELAADQAQGRLAFVSPLWGRLDIPMGQIAEYSAAPAIAGRQHPDAPFILLRNGDAVAARVEKVGPKELTVNTEFGRTQIDRSALAAIVLSAEPPPIDARQGQVYLVELTDGQRVYCDELLAASERVIILRRGDARCRVDQRAIRRIVWPGATIACASAMELGGNGVGYFGRSVIPCRDRNARGGPLRLGHRWFTRGIGTRSRSRVTFKLDARWTYLQGWVGLDPWLGRTGHCTAAVMADDEQVFRAKLRGADEGVRLAIPLGRAKQIELRTDFGPRGDLGDYVNWCDLLLIGQRSGAGQ